MRSEACISRCSRGVAVKCELPMSNRRAEGVAFVNIFQAYNVTQREIQAVFVDSQNLIRFLPRASACSRSAIGGIFL